MGPIHSDPAIRRLPPLEWPPAADHRSPREAFSGSAFGRSGRRRTPRQSAVWAKNHASCVAPRWRVAPRSGVGDRDLPTFACWVCASPIAPPRPGRQDPAPGATIAEVGRGAPFHADPLGRRVAARSVRRRRPRPTMGATRPSATERGRSRSRSRAAFDRGAEGDAGVLGVRQPSPAPRLPDATSPTSRTRVVARPEPTIGVPAASISTTVARRRCPTRHPGSGGRRIGPCLHARLRSPRGERPDQALWCSLTAQSGSGRGLGDPVADTRFGGDQPARPAGRVGRVELATQPADIDVQVVRLRRRTLFAQTARRQSATGQQPARLADHRLEQLVLARASAPASVAGDRRPPDVRRRWRSARDSDCPPRVGRRSAGPPQQRRDPCPQLRQRAERLRDVVVGAPASRADDLVGLARRAPTGPGSASSRHAGSRSDQGRGHRRRAGPDRAG